MIISHRHRFIFLKPLKVAGTSIEVALAPHCGEDDILTPIGDFDSRWDEDRYQVLGRKHPGYRRHGSLALVRRNIGEAVWSDYFKFAVVRNPWDLVVSQYHWATRSGVLTGSVLGGLRLVWRKPWRVRRNLQNLGSRVAMRLLSLERLPFSFFASWMLGYYPHNDRFYFDASGRVGLDFVIRYEHLEADFHAVCARLGLPAVPLPALKTRTRPKKEHYSSYYDERTRDHVRRRYARQIEHFGYGFDDRCAGRRADPALTDPVASGD